MRFHSVLVANENCGAGDKDFSHLAAANDCTGGAVLNQNF
jgi:hypothetical protein